MKRTRLNRYILVSILFALIPLHGLAQGQIGEAKAIETVRNFYIGLNSYAQYAYEYQGKEHYYLGTNEHIISFFVSGEVVVMDINHLQNGKDLQDGPIEQYLRILNQIAKDRVVKFELVNKPQMIREMGGVQVTVNVLSTENSYQNTFGFTFIGEKIANICVMDKYKRIPNINELVQHEEEKKTVYPLPFKTNLGFGVKLGSKTGLPLSIGFRGLTQNWFLSRVNIGAECIFLLNQDGYLHYPSSTEGIPSTLTYASVRNGDFGVGINLGYTFYPGKHQKGKHHYFSALIGLGGAFYDFWDEKTGPSSSDYESHYSSAFYLKPSLCWEWEPYGIGAVVGYYICPKFSSIQGVNIQMTIKLF